MRHKILIALLALHQVSFAGQVMKQDENEPRRFSTRHAQAEPRTWQEERSDETQTWQGNPSFPIQLGSSPNAPAICQQKDLAHDQEFRQCMRQLVDEFQSKQRSQAFEKSE